MRVQGALSLFFVATAITCTFPDVHYRRGDGGGGDTCDAMDQCVTNTSNCRNTVINKYDPCKATCGQPNKPKCSECEADKQAGLEDCALDCVTCVIEKQDGCDGTASCEALAGL